MEKGKYWGSSGYWSGAIPSTSTANNYFVGQGATDSITFRTLVKSDGTPAESDKFPDGNTLWFGYNTDGTYSTVQAVMALKAWNFTINDLQLGNSLINQAMTTGTANMLGAMTVNGTVTFGFADEADRIINVQSSIAGAGEITLVEGANNENLIISSANNAFTGTLNVSQNSSVVLSGANAMQNAKSIVLNSGSTLKLTATQAFVENSITGSGTLKIAADQSSTADQTALYGISDTFTGTINVTNSARAEYSKPLSSNTKLVIDNGAQFRVPAQNNPVINCDISLSGTGKVIASKNAGALVFHECSGTSTVNGNISVDAYSMIGSYYIANALFNGDIDTNGYTLEFRQTREGGSGNNSSFTVAGDVLSTGGTLGTLWLAYDVKPSVVDTHLYIGNSSSADVNSPTNQTINANLTNANKNEIVVQPGANRTVTVNGTMAHNTNNNNNKKGFIKNGEGTLVLTGGLSTQMTVNAGVFELTGSAIENVTGIITVNDGGTLELNVAEGWKTLSLTQQNQLFSAGKVIKTGDGELKIDAAQGAIDAESLVVSSGRLDMKEYFKGQLEVKSGATFSPGNSVGSLTIGESAYGGGFILNEDGAKLLMEIGGSSDDLNDSLIVQNGNILIGNDSIIELTLADNSTLKGGDTFTAILYGSNSGEEGFKENLLSHVSSYYFTNLDYIPYGSGYAITGALDPNAVPEPSTWALLALGAAGLLYWRKRK
ncbi:MAG: PEP-CTERM sorting domain-containing protein [Thermoguttaceae bacterium]|nr:PEP-CTERM sorting domain-containing protein [Thermoguttaceae bacterium]